MKKEESRPRIRRGAIEDGLTEGAQHSIRRIADNIAPYFDIFALVRNMFYHYITGAWRKDHESSCRWSVRLNVGERSHDRDLLWRSLERSEPRSEAKAPTTGTPISRCESPGKSPNRPKETLRLNRIPRARTQDTWMTQFAEPAGPRAN